MNWISRLFGSTKLVQRTASELKVNQSDDVIVRAIKILEGAGLGDHPDFLKLVDGAAGIVKAYQDLVAEISTTLTEPVPEQPKIVAPKKTTTKSKSTRKPRASKKPVVVETIKEPVIIAKPKRVRKAKTTVKESVDS